VTAGVCDAKTEWHFTQERRIGAGHAHSAEIIPDEKHKFVSSGDELITLQQWPVRTSVSICFNCLEQMPIVVRIDRPKIDTHTSRWSTCGRIQHVSGEAPHGNPPFPSWVTLPNEGARGRVCRRHFYSPDFLELELLRLLSTAGRPFHIVKKRMGRPVCKGYW
jgi:hypothetical protein